MRTQAQQIERTEQLLRELASTLAEDVRTGDRTEDEARGIYDRAAQRWMYES